jgi:hypothetical protein
MKGLMGIIGLTATVTALTVGTAGASGASSCVGGFSEARAPQALRVTGDTCNNARKLANLVVGLPPKGCLKTDKKGHVTLRTACVVRSYHCTGASISKGFSLSVTCRRGARVVRFRY